jgi:Uma2 family endonuclease
MAHSSPATVTYDQLCTWPDDGRQYQIFDGEVVVTPSPVRLHQEVLRRLVLTLSGVLPAGAQLFFTPFDVVLAPRVVLQPDLLVILEPNLGILQDVVRGAPDLVVEVLSASTADWDRRRKKALYARHQIPEYWIVDGEAEEIEIFRLAEGASVYRRAALLTAGDRVTSPLLPHLDLDVTTLLRG